MNGFATGMNGRVDAVMAGSFQRGELARDAVFEGIKPIRLVPVAPSAIRAAEAIIEPVGADTDPPGLPSRVPRDERMRGYVFRHHRTGGNQCPAADGPAGKDD